MVSVKTGGVQTNLTFEWRYRLYDIHLFKRLSVRLSSAGGKLENNFAVCRDCRNVGEDHLLRMCRPKYFINHQKT